MEHEKPDVDGNIDTLPIPTYDEAINSRPSSSQSFLGAQEISHDAERQGLLGRREDTNIRGYRPPTAESVRDSLDDLASSIGSSRSGSTEELRRELQQMDVLDSTGVGSHDAHLLSGTRLSKHFTNFTHSLSSINLPFRQWLPSWDYIKAKAEGLNPTGLVINWILICRLFALLMVVLLVYLLFISDLFRLHRGGGRMPADPELVRSYVRENVKESSIREFLQYLTSYDHMAGTRGGRAQADFIEQVFADSHLEGVGLETFEVYLNFPIDGGRKVAIIDPPELAWEAKIEEEPIYEDGRAQAPVFHGYSKSGNVTGHLIYANYGSLEDFRNLKRLGIDVSGSIVLTRYGGTEGDRAVKVLNAQQAGAVGCIIYSDPADDDVLVRGAPFPDGPFMPADGVQRGTVGLSAMILGDPLTPGYASLPAEDRRDPVEKSTALNRIPSIPLAMRDAQKLLQALKGHGKTMGEDWGKGGVPDVEWWTGDKHSPIVQLQNEQDEVERAPIYNVLGQILGVEQPDKAIVVGNHHDAWCFGAGDPGSGTAVLLEVVRIFGELLEMGWRPLRTIVFASWDAEEYNLVGSTEHVEVRKDQLRQDGIAYLNVDVGVVGTDFEASASPALSTPLLHVLERVLDPATNETLRATFAKKRSKIGGLGAGSDYAAFQDIAGVSSLDMTFNGPVYPYHSCYDNFDWMAKFGDPDFTYHQTMAQILALLVLDLSDRELLPFDFNVFADAVAGYVHDLETEVASKGKELDTSRLNDAVTVFKQNAREFHEWDQAWSNLVFGAQGGLESNALAIKRVSHNARMVNFEGNLLMPEGLPGRTQFKHALFAPHPMDSYQVQYFPSIRGAMDRGDWQQAQQEVVKVSQIIVYASQKLNH